MLKNTLISVATVVVFAGMTSGANADLVISKSKTSNVSCDAGICNATAANAVLNVKDLSKMLATSDVHVFAEGVATDITVSAPFRWASAHQLTLGAYGSLSVKAAITVAGTSGLTIATNVAGNGGDFRLVNAGQISFWDASSSLTVNGTTYTLVNSLPALIAAIAANPAGNFAFANDYNAAQDGSYAHASIPTTFNGVFEGLGNTIGNLSFFNAASNLEKIALFSELASTGQISNLKLADVSMRTSDGYVAPLVATNRGTITHASATGTITNVTGANWDAAGLVFDNEGTITRSHAAVSMNDIVTGAGGLATLNGGTISFSDASGSISSGFYSGGLVALSDGTITDSYAQGDVTATSNQGSMAGGLAAQSDGTIQRCFATGAVRGGTSDPARKGPVDPNGVRFKFNGMNLGGLVGYSNSTIQYAYATGSVTGIESDRTRRSVVGGLIGRTYSTNTLFQAYSLGKVDLNAKKYLGGVIGADTGTGSNTAAYWNRDSSGIENPAQGAGNIFDDKGLKILGDKQFKNGTLIGNLDPAVWAQNPTINNGYPYLLANPPSQ